MTLPTEDVAALVARLREEGDELCRARLIDDIATALSTLAGERDEWQLQFAAVNSILQKERREEQSARARLKRAEARATTAEAQVVAMREALERIASESVMEEPFRNHNRIMSRDDCIRCARTALLAGTPPSGAETQEKVDGN